MWLNNLFRITNLRKMMLSKDLWELWMPAQCELAQQIFFKVPSTTFCEKIVHHPFLLEIIHHFHQQVSQQLLLIPTLTAVNHPSLEITWHAASETLTDDVNFAAPETSEVSDADVSSAISPFLTFVRNSKNYFTQNQIFHSNHSPKFWSWSIYRSHSTANFSIKSASWRSKLL